MASARTEFVSDRVRDVDLTREDILSLLQDRRNWGRWGDDDEKGAINLITPEKTRKAAALVRSGRTVSLSREYPDKPGPGNSRPAEHYSYVHSFTRSGAAGSKGGAAGDYLGISFHQSSCTHLDSLCHMWDENGMWNGRDPGDVFSAEGANFGDVDQWKDGIVTRGVLLDVPRFRGETSIKIGEPIHADELEAVAKHQNVTVEPGDALVVYGGRDAWAKENPEWNSETPTRPGLHASCLRYLRDTDVSVLAWDFMDEHPCAELYDIPFGVHAALISYGIALVDNCLLTNVADVCAEEGRYEFMLTLAPLRVVGGSGCPINPIAIF